MTQHLTCCMYCAPVGRQSLVSHVKDSKSNSDINANADPEFCVDKGFFLHMY